MTDLLPDTYREELTRQHSEKRFVRKIFPEKQGLTRRYSTANECDQGQMQSQIESEAFIIALRFVLLQTAHFCVRTLQLQ